MAPKFPPRWTATKSHSAWRKFCHGPVYEYGGNFAAILLRQSISQGNMAEKRQNVVFPQQLSVRSCTVKLQKSNVSGNKREKNFLNTLQSACTKEITTMTDNIHRESKNTPPNFSHITSSSIDRFSIFFH